MYLIEKNINRISKIDERSLSKLGFKEKDNLQEWIANNPTFFDEELLFIQKEFCGFDETQERLDLLALDKLGDVVVIENKLDDSGRDVMWQALKYASYCASLSKAQIKNIYQQYLDKNGIDENAETNISDFMGVSDFEEVTLNKTQRIIMVAGNFRKEVTSTVLWLLNNYKLRIQCFKITPYSLSDQLFLKVEQIIPVKEQEEYMIRMAEKKQEDSDTQEELKTRHRMRMEFWNKLLEIINNSETKLFQNVNPSKDNWITGGVGMTGVSLNFVVSKTYGRSELYISRGSAEDNKFIFDSLNKKKEQIEEDFGGELIWERLDTKKASRIKYETEGVNCYDPGDWDEMINFMVDGMIRMEKALIKPLRAINVKLKSHGLE